MDFSLLLVIAVLVTGAVWLCDVLWLRRRRRANGVVDDASHQPWYVEYSRSFFPVLLVVLVVRSFVIEPFQIPSGSMEPTLDIGDFIVVSKFSYGMRLPVINTKIVPTGEPQRGDVMVFRYPPDPSVNFIKRVVGLPGDHVRYVDKRLYINGELVEKDFVSNQVPANPGEELWLETLGDVTHSIYNSPRDPGRGFEGRVPEGEYFVMGDNRDHSSDSRYWGFVPEGNVVGRAFAVWMHWGSGLPSFSAARMIH